jgi:hypothetical protein
MPMYTGKQVERVVGSIYQCRKLRVMTPEGSFTASGLWMPSERERGEDEGFKNVQAPTVKNRYSYREYCRTKKHVHVLVERWILGCPVPFDVARAFDTKKTQIVPPDAIPELVTEFVRYLESRAIRVGNGNDKS